MGWAAAWLRVGLLSACRSRKCSDHEDGATIISHAPTPPGGRQPPRDSNRLRAWRISEPGRRIATSEKPHRCRVAQFLRIDRRVILDSVGPPAPPDTGTPAPEGGLDRIIPRPRGCVAPAERARWSRLDLSWREEHRVVLGSTEFQKSPFCRRVQWAAHPLQPRKPRPCSRSRRPLRV